ncbi:unnamed protein product, partial [Chrysoparadoxa australica]
IKVTHGADQFGAGESVILTLQDQDILERDDHGMVKGLNAEDDELENVTLKDDDRRKELHNIKKKAQRYFRYTPGGCVAI